MQSTLQRSLWDPAEAKLLWEPHLCLIFYSTLFFPRALTACSEFLHSINHLPRKRREPNLRLLSYLKIEGWAKHARFSSCFVSYQDEYLKNCNRKFPLLASYMSWVWRVKGDWRKVYLHSARMDERDLRGTQRQQSKVMIVTQYLEIWQ